MSYKETNTIDNQPLVSIIIPTYNVERYVEECIESLLNQTYTNIEIIVLDDGSTDATVYLLKQYEDKIQLIVNSNNKGQGARRNEGMKLANGKYIYFVDSDDWIEPETVEEAVKQLEETQTDIVRFNGVSFDEGIGSVIKENNYNFSGILENKRLYIGEEVLRKSIKSFTPSPCLYIVKKEFLDCNNLLFIEGALHEDEYFTTVLFANLNKMIYLDKNYYHRRYRTASTMTVRTNHHKLKSFVSYIKIFKSLEAEYMKEKYSDLQRCFIKRQLLSIYNGLQMSDVHPEQKRQLSKFKSVTFRDKLFIRGVRLKQHLKYKNKK
ncbi:glycosyltransferase [Alkalibacterium psychrotolerans]